MTSMTLMNLKEEVPMAKPRLTLLREQFYADTPHKVDREAGIIFDVKILGNESKNGYKYSPAAIKEAVEEYKKRSSYIDHVAEGEESRERGFGDFFGNFQNIRSTDKGAWGNLHFLKSHPLAEQVCEAAEKFPEHFGISHDAYGKKTEVNGEMIVESVPRVNSIDIVTSPATNSSLFESHRPKEPTVATKKTSIRKLLEAAGPKGLMCLKRLKENDPGMIGMSGPMMDAPMDVEDTADAVEPTPEELMEQALDAHVLAIVHDDSKDPKAKTDAILALLQAHGDIQTAINGGAPAEKPETPASTEGDTPVVESVKLKDLETRLNAESTARQLLESKLAKTESEANARKLLESANVEATDERVEAVAQFGDTAKQTRLIESWPKRDAIQLGQRPSESRPLRESAVPVGAYDDERKNFESQLRSVS